MSTTAPEQQPGEHAWLPVDDTLAWLQLAAGSELASVAEWCRRASASYCERQRPDLWELAPVELPDGGRGPLARTGRYLATADTVLAGMIGAARLFARRSTPAGLASFGEFGASEVMRLDPDVSRLLGTGRHGTPAVG